ncbi:MAG TPA: methyltransferase domain-containing protein [Phycisphaerae bacterium]|nr:methyltransferase domain-containing protein [Phycisphaerae bacterium]HPS53298.1 methyltransferase domain-containing protein [Phycisphaerae bacterium]
MKDKMNIWQGKHKIPWDDYDFSRRMLAEHLTQEHDMASRRIEWIERQVTWIHKNLFDGQPSKIMDLGCGPGLYLHRLVKLGHICCGVDFSPASIEYANLHNPDRVNCIFFKSDIREITFGVDYDLIMMLFGEFNTFSPAEALSILRKSCDSLHNHGGRMILEISTPQAVSRIGRSESSREEAESGLFSDEPYVCETSNRWLPEYNAAVQTFRVEEKSTEKTTIYRSTTRALSDDELRELIMSAGFASATRLREWPCNTDDLQLWLIEK